MPPPALLRLPSAAADSAAVTVSVWARFESVTLAVGNGAMVCWSVMVYVPPIPDNTGPVGGCTMVPVTVRMSGARVALKPLLLVP